MSAELKLFLETVILPGYDKSSLTLEPQLQEEYLTPEGWLDRYYICKVKGIHLSTPTFRKGVKQVLGNVVFNKTSVESNISKEEFLALYKFGKLPDIRSWVGYVYNKTGKVVKREDVFKWVLSA